MLSYNMVEVQVLVSSDVFNSNLFECIELKTKLNVSNAQNHKAVIEISISKNAHAIFPRDGGQRYQIKS